MILYLQEMKGPAIGWNSRKVTTSVVIKESKRKYCGIMLMLFYKKTGD